jgi:hypothetical protein
VLKTKDLEILEKVCVRHTASTHLAKRIRVNYLLAKGASGKVRPLGYVENGVERGFVDCASINRPETAENAEKRRFSAAVRPNNKQVVSVFKSERQSFDEDVTVRRDNGSICGNGLA